MMRLPFLFASVVLACATPAQTGLILNTDLGRAGGPCGPFDCVPVPVSATSGSSVEVQVSSGVAALLVSLPPAICVPFPGINGSLMTRVPPLLLPLSPTFIVRYYINTPIPPPVPCLGRYHGGTLTMPPLPVGTQLVIQAIALDPQGQLGLSNGALLSIR